MKTTADDVAFPDDEYDEEDHVEALADEDYTAPDGIELRLELRISYTDPDHAIDVPLGYYDKGRWRTLRFVDGDAVSLCLNPKALVSWLAGSNWFQRQLLDENSAAETVRETLSRCIALSEASKENERGN